MRSNKKIRKKSNLPFNIKPSNNITYCSYKAFILLGRFQN